MIDLPYSLVIEATDDPSFFSFYSPELKGLPEWATQLKTASIRQNGACKITWRY